MITVLVVDDQPLVRHAVRDILTDSGEIRVIGEASNGREAVAFVAASAPDVVLMDIRMPELDGIAATEQICASGSPSRILILTTFEEDEFVMAALRSGASGFIGKGVRNIHNSSVDSQPPNGQGLTVRSDDRYRDSVRRRGRRDPFRRQGSRAERDLARAPST